MIMGSKQRGAKEWHRHIAVEKRWWGASERLTFNNPAQARKGAVWGWDALYDISVPEGRALTRSSQMRSRVFDTH